MKRKMVTIDGNTAAAYVAHATNEVIAIYAGTQGLADQVPVADVEEYERALLRFMETSYPEIGKDIAENKMITDETDPKLRAAIEEFNSTWG